MRRRRRLPSKEFLNSDKKASGEDFKKLIDTLMQDGPRIEYRNPDKWRDN